MKIMNTISQANEKVHLRLIADATFKGIQNQHNERQRILSKLKLQGEESLTFTEKIVIWDKILT